MAKGVEELPATGSGELRKFRQLVELQSELVEQARKNELAEQQCDALWRELENDTQRAKRYGRASAWMAGLARLRERLLADLRRRSDPDRH